MTKHNAMEDYKKFLEQKLAGTTRYEGMKATSSQLASMAQQIRKTTPIRRNLEG